MKYRITFFSLFLSIVTGLIIGVYRYPFLTAFLFCLTFFLLVIFSYRIYLLFEKLGVFVYEKYLKKAIDSYRKTKETIQKQP